MRTSTVLQPLPRRLAQWAKQMGSALGDEAGEDFGEVVDEMMEAESVGCAPWVGLEMFMSGE